MASFRLFQAFVRHEHRWTILVTLTVAVLAVVLCALSILFCFALSGDATAQTAVAAFLGSGGAGQKIVVGALVGSTLVSLGMLAYVVHAILRRERQHNAEYGQMELLVDTLEREVLQKKLDLKDLSRRALDLLDSTNSAILAVDRQGSITYVNAVGSKLTGYAPEEMLGQHIHNILSPTDREGASTSCGECPVCKAIRTASETRFDLLRLSRKDDTTMLVSGAVSTLHEDGELTGSVVIFHDVGTPRQAEIWRRTIFKNSGESILVWDEKQRLVDVNHAFCRLVGFGSLQDIQENFASLHANAQPCGLAWEEALKYLFSCCERDGNVASRWIFRHKSGREIPCEGHFVYMTGPLGACYFTIMHDISRILAYEDHLKQNIAEINTLRVKAEASAVAKSEFLARMSHEIRTPMNAILGMNHMLLSTQLDARQRHYLDSVKYAATNLLGLLNDILDISKIEAGRLELECAPFALREMVDSQLALFSVTAQSKQVELFCYVHPAVPDCVRGDRLRLTQVLTNLLNNAVKFTEKGRISLDVRLLDDADDRPRLQFMVRDTGIGMTTEQSQLLFQPFQQADASISRRFGGTGLGLAIARNLVEHMGGSISVTSQPGQGSSFVFDVLLEKDYAATSAWRHEFAELSSLLHGRRAIVDTPEPEFAMLLSNLLSDFGMSCLCVSNTQEGVSRARDARAANQAFDLAIVDGDLERKQASRQVVHDELQDRDLPAVLLMPVMCEDHMGQEKDLEVRARTHLLHKPVTHVRLGRAVAFVLGLVESDRPASDNGQPQGQYTALLSGTRVLLVEDNEINQEVALALLEQVGVVATLARNGEEAVALCRAQSFDLVLMDVRMPVMGGIDATRAIRAMAAGWTHSVPILALTADAMSEDRAEALASGMNDHIAKPIEPDLLFAKMAAWLGKVVP